MTAKTAAERGLNVLLVERELEVGIPDKCGEFLPSLKEMHRLAPQVLDLAGLFDPPEYCIVNRTKHVKFIFPNGVEISIPFYGLVVERKLYDKHLTNEAARAGAEVATLTRFVALLKGGRGLKIKDTDGAREIIAKTVVAADGAYSLVARKAGLPVSRDPLDYSVGYQFEMVNIDHDPDFIDMYIGEDIAPGTYAWIIPKGEDIANVGTGVRAPYMKVGMNVRDYQKNFIEKHPLSSVKLTKAVPTAIKSGCIPVGGPLERTSGDAVIAVGDAGGHTIPTVGGGVPPALICGRIAGNTIADHIFDGKSLVNFDLCWKRELGKTLENSLRMRKMSDIVFKNEKMIDLITKRGWLTEEMVMKFVICDMDAKMILMEKTLGLMGM
jgi:digeranylgeranylglycerophospholipid reductase